MTIKTIQKHTKKLFGMSLGFSLVFAGGSLEANVSKTFRSSINAAGTAGLVNGVWDYVTTPYLYGIQEEDAISMLYVGPSNDVDTEGFNFGLRLGDIFPVYAAVGLKNTKSASTRREYSASTGTSNREDKALETTDSQFVLMVGSIVPVVDLGVGIFAQGSRNRRITEQIEQGDSPSERTEEANREIRTREELELYENKYGLEVGVGDKQLKWAWSFSLDFRDFDQPFSDTETEVGGIDITNDAPLFDFYPSTVSGIDEEDNVVTVAINDNLGSAANGFSRQEIGLNFLGWFSTSATHTGNVGLELNSYFIPEVSGTNSTSGREASLTGFRVQPTFFYDYDFSVSDDGKSVLRLTPGLRTTLHSESAEVAARDAPVVAGDPRGNYVAESFDIEINEQEVEFLFGVKLVYQVVSVLKFTLAYLPSFTLHHLREEELSAHSTEENLTNTIEHDFLTNTLDDFNLGMSYQPSEQVSMNFQVFTDPNSGEFNVARFRLGLDFILE